MMWFERVMRGLVAMLTACSPATLCWLLIVATIELRDATRTTPPVPNPHKAPGWSLGLLDVLVYADAYFAGTIFYQWLLPGTVLLVVLGVWAAGIPVLSKERAPGWPVPRFRKVVGVSLATGAFLSVPWLYAWVRVLCNPML